MKILVAEDSSIWYDLFSKHLAKAGYDFDVAMNGQEALNFLGNTKYDAVITDIEMPHKSGFDVLQYVKDQGGKIPCLLVSSLEWHEHNNSRVSVLDWLEKKEFTPFTQFRKKHGGVIQDMLEFLSSVVKNNRLVV